MGDRRRIGREGGSSACGRRLHCDNTGTKLEQERVRRPRLLAARAASRVTSSGVLLSGGLQAAGVLEVPSWNPSSACRLQCSSRVESRSRSRSSGLSELLMSGRAPDSVSDRSSGHSRCVGVQLAQRDAEDDRQGHLRKPARALRLRRLRKPAPAPPRCGRGQPSVDSHHRHRSREGPSRSRAKGEARPRESTFYPISHTTQPPRRGRATAAAPHSS